MNAVLRQLLIAICGAGVIGCADATGIQTRLSPTSPVYSAGCDPSVPCYGSTGDIPNEAFPRIHSVHPVVYWEGDRAVASSAMYYYGNRAEETGQLVISGRSNAERDVSATSEHFWISNYLHQTPGAPLTAPAGACGHLANLSMAHKAVSKFFIEWQGFTSTDVQVSGGHSARQPDCTCGSGDDGSPDDDQHVTSISADAGPAASTSDCSGGGGPGGGVTRSTCYTMTVDHYWYFPDTNTYEYRFSEEMTWCEEDTA